MFVSKVIRWNLFGKMWSILLLRTLKNNDLQCWLKTAGVITNDRFLECIVFAQWTCTMHAGETRHCKSCYKGAQPTAKYSVTTAVGLPLEYTRFIVIFQAVDLRYMLQRELRIYATVIWYFYAFKLVKCVHLCLTWACLVYIRLPLWRHHTCMPTYSPGKIAPNWIW